MKTRNNLALFGIAILSLIFLMGMASANIVFTDVVGNGVSVSQGNTATISFKLVEDNNGGGNAAAIDFNVPITLTSGATNTFNSRAIVIGAIPTLNQSDTSQTMSLGFDVPSTQALGTYTGILQPIGTYTASFEPLAITLTVTSDTPSEIQSCSTTGNPGNLEVKSIDFTNKGLKYNGFGEDDEWFLLEEIEVDIEIENDGDYDVDNVEITWGIYDTENNEWLIDLEEEKDFDLKDGDEETLTVSFVLDDDLDIGLEDLSDGSHYRFYVTAIGEVNDNDSPNDGEETCVVDYEPASIIIESNFVIINNIEIPEAVSCGETIQITANVWNIGDRDQDEIKVQITDRGNELGLSKFIEVGDIDAFDKEEIIFTFKIPNNADEGTYNLLFEVLDEDGDVYENDFDDDLSEYSTSLTVGNCGIPEEDLIVSAVLASPAKAGQDVIVKATITNNGNDATYTINAAGYAQWASAVQINQPTITLNEGQSQDVLFTFTTDRNAAGTQNFFIEILVDGQVTRQPVTFNLESASFFDGITGAAIGNNAYLWGLGILNIILVIIIIIVAIKVARR